jgi:hypothetical protein
MAQACQLIARLEARYREAPALAELDTHGAPAAWPECGPLTLRQHWEALIGRAIACRSFISGETYDTSLATVPDDKRLSLPLDPHLVVADFGKP